MARRPVAAVAAALLLVEAVGIVLINMVLGISVDRQHMSLAGLDPDAMSVSTWIMGGVFGLYLAACAVALLLTAIRDRAPGRLARALLIGAAVVHAVLAIVVVGVVGWAAFAFMMVMFGLIVLALIVYGSADGGGPERAGTDAEAGNGEPGGSTEPAPAT
ncbi:hypothetical protein ACH429_15900 [Streptomyces pathocidini]|uniref:Integral membrane protein n=1 Tax=Streptomyces pathocidini TaxID=1650571 RepID=A0ABW7UV19_9ACTN|nr:hypothetical protein [Streptomyces pathocidini]